MKHFISNNKLFLVKEGSFKQIESGTPIKGTIRNKEITGKLAIEENRLYFCQNVFDGAKPNKTFGFNFGWVFGLDKWSDAKVNFEEIEEEIKLSKDVLFIINAFEKERKISKLFFKNLFSVKVTGYPECCGSTIFSDFTMINSANLANLKEKIQALDKKEKELMKEFIIHQIFTGTTNTNFILKDIWSSLIVFFKALDIEPVDTFTNANTGNILHLYSVNT